MKSKTLLLATLTGMLAGAIGYWFQPYNQRTVLGMNMWLVMGVGAFLGSLFLFFFLKEKPGNKAALFSLGIAYFVSLGVALAVLARIIYDTLFWDATSHNLAPFEILICFLIAIPCAFAGGFLSFLFTKFRR